MTELQRLKVREIELRAKLNELSGVDELTPEQRSELDTANNEYGDVQAQMKAAILAEGTAPAPEPTEPEQRASVGAIVQAAVEHRATTGAEAEVQAELGLNSNQIPLSMLVEHRTSGQSSAPSDTGRTTRPIIPFVFPQGSLAFLGIRQDTVPVGDAVYTVLSTAAAPGRPTGGNAQATSAAAFTASTLQPARIQAGVFYRREDAGRLAGMDSALRMNLSAALSDELDEVVIDHLLTGSTLTANAASAADTYATYRSRFVYAHIDGSYASMASDLRLVVGSDTYSDMAGTYRANEDSMNALGAIMSETSGIRVSAHAPATASNKQNGLVRIGMNMDYAVGIWQGVTIIPDEVTMADEGEVKLTAVMLYARALLRSSGFAKVEAQHS